MNAKRDRIYPKISVGDDFKVYKKKYKFDKGHNTSVWSKDKHKVENIEESHGQSIYFLSGYPKPFRRHEILI